MKKLDSIAFGLVAGIGLPVSIFGIVYLGLLIQGANRLPASFFENMQLLAIAINGIAIRMLMVRWEMDQTGKGMLAVTLAMAIAWVAWHNL